MPGRFGQHHIELAPLIFRQSGKHQLGQRERVVLLEGGPRLLNCLQRNGEIAQTLVLLHEPQGIHPLTLRAALEHLADIRGLVPPLSCSSTGLGDNSFELRRPFRTRRQRLA